jgi:hypothetical protein
MNSIGAMTRWVRPLRGTFSKQAILPSRSGQMVRGPTLRRL